MLYSFYEPPPISGFLVRRFGIEAVLDAMAGCCAPEPPPDIWCDLSVVPEDGTLMEAAARPVAAEAPVSQPTLGCKAGGGRRKRFRNNSPAPAKHRPSSWQRAPPLPPVPPPPPPMPQLVPHPTRSLPPPPHAVSYCYGDVQGRWQGPFPEATVLDWVARGALPGATPVLVSGSADVWTVATLPRLVVALPLSPPPPPPPPRPPPPATLVWSAPPPPAPLPHAPPTGREADVTAREAAVAVREAAVERRSAELDACEDGVAKLEAVLYERGAAEAAAPAGMVKLEDLSARGSQGLPGSFATRDDSPGLRGSIRDPHKPRSAEKVAFFQLRR